MPPRLHGPLTVPAVGLRASTQAAGWVALSLLSYLALNLGINRWQTPGGSLVIALICGLVALGPLLCCRAVLEIGAARCAFIMAAVFLAKAGAGSAHFVYFIQPDYFDGNAEYSYHWDYVWLDQSLGFVADVWRTYGLFSPLGEEYWLQNKNAGLLGFMALNYYTTGNFSLNIMPWNLLFGCYSAILVSEIARSVGLKGSRLRAVFWIVLLWPSNLMPSLLWRDTTGQCLIILGSYLLVQTRYTLRYWLVLLPLAAFFGYLHRDVYLASVLIGGLVVILLRLRSSRFAPLLVGASVLGLLGAAPLARSLGLAAFGRSMEDGAALIDYAKLLGLPIRILRALMGPFPWTQVFQKVSAYEYQVFDYLQHTLNSALLWCAVPLAWRAIKQQNSIDFPTTSAFLLFATGVMATGIHTAYVSVGIPLLVPLALSTGPEYFSRRLLHSFVIFLVANILFVGLNLSGANFFQNISGGY